MLLEGEVNWTLIFAALAACSLAVAVVATLVALRNGRNGRHVSSRLDRAQQTAVSTDRRLYEILNAIPVALVQTDTQGRFVFANRAAHQLLGRRDVELLGLRFHSATWGITFPDGRPIPPDMLPSARALRGQTVKGFQHLLANPSTRRRMLVSITAMPICDELGQITGSTAAIVETEGLTTPEPAAPDNVLPFIAPPEHPMSRRVFEAFDRPLVVVSVHGLVREANAAALEQASGPVTDADFADRFVVEPDRIKARQTLRAALASPSGSAASLVAEGENGARTAWQILPLLDARGRVDALLLTGSPVTVEAVAVDPVATDPVPVEPVPVEPEPAPLVDSSPAPDEAGVEPGPVVSMDEPTHAAPAPDLSPRPDPEGRRYEDIGRLTGGLAQDLSALLAVMTGALEMVSDQAGHPDKVRRLAGAALGAGRRGEALTRRMAALTAGETPLPDQALDAGVLLRALEGRLSAAAGPADLMVVAPVDLTPVRLDPVAFEVTVLALVTNAVEAGAGSVAVQLEPGAGGVVLVVRDDGTGMEPDVARRAAEPFFTTRPGQAGLGLAQATAFARRSGGELVVDTLAGRGTEVRLGLPGLSD